MLKANRSDVGVPAEAVSFALTGADADSVSSDLFDARQFDARQFETLLGDLFEARDDPTSPA
mgnify:FL=1